jgi:hypothetical protein
MLDAGGLGAKLLRAGVDERPSSRIVERAVLAVGAGTATLGAASLVGAATSAPTAALGAGAVLKLLSIGAAVGVAASGATWGVSTALQQESAPERTEPSMAATVERHSEPVLPTPRSEAPLPSVSASMPAPTPVRPPPPSAAFDVREDGAPLAPEVEMVDRAHGALRRGDASSVLAELSGYEQTFQTPRLLPEVFALRMEASQKLGDEPAARLWAGRLLSRFPKSAQAARAKALLAE